MRLLLLIICCLISNVVWAINVLPSSVQPERQTTAPKPIVEPSAPSNLLSIVPQQIKAPPGSENVHFVFNGFILEGATIFPESKLAPLYENEIGKEINLIELYSIANKIEAFYMSEGYILTRVTIPAQEINPGEKIKLLIVEGYIQEIDIKTENDSIKDFLSEMAENIRLSRPLKIQDLESTLLKMNDLPGIDVRSILSPSPTTPGSSLLTIEVHEKDFGAEAHADNRGTSYTGPFEYLGTITVNNPGGYISQTIVEGTAATPFHEMSATSLTHTKPFGDEGAFAQGVINYSQVNPGYTLSVLDIHGYSAMYQATVQQPLIRQRTHNLSAWMRYDVSDSKTNSLDQLLYWDIIESIRASLVFNANDAWQGNNLMSLEISRGINVITGENKPHIERSRYFGTKDYTKVNATFTRLQTLPWNFAIFLSGQGQYAANPLLVAEEFGVGGEDFGIAYDYFEISGDSGYAARAELRYSYFPNQWYLSFLQPFISFDGGQTFLKDAGGFSQSLTSLGGGFRFEITDYFNGQVEVGQPLTKTVEATDSKNARAFFYFTLDV